MRTLFALLLLLASSLSGFASDAPKAKLGPNAQPIFAATDFLRRHPAPDYWAMAAFYQPQATDADCTVAATVMAINALRGLSPFNDDAVLTEKALLDDVGDATLRSFVAEGGSGVTFAEFQRNLRASLDKEGLPKARVVAVQPKAGDRSALIAFRKALAANEASGANVMLVAFNQGAVTGAWDGPHASPIGAYDAGRDRVLVMDVDREWYVPYWTPTAVLFAAMMKPAPAGMGRLAGDTGGYILITK